MEKILLDAFDVFMGRGDYDDAFVALKKVWGQAVADGKENRTVVYKAVKEFRSIIGHVDTQEARELYKRSYLLTAREIFDDFMVYIEWNRPLSQQYWLVRRKQLKPVADALQMLEDDELDELFLSMPPRVGKALANDTPILTRNGWKNHGDLVVGDEVVGLDGNFKKVVYVHPKCMLDRKVEITNGETIICHANHEWMVHDRARTGKPDYLAETHVLEKRTLEYGAEPGKRGHRYVLQLPAHGYVHGDEKDLPLDPYTFGAWLGDGSNKQPRVCCSEKDRCVIDRIVKNGLPIRWSTVHKDTGVLYFGFDMRKQLQTMGLCHSREIHPKYIPDVYLTASVEQRLNLLAGLLDTDGTYMRSERRYQFTTSEEKLRDTFVELISTFGWRASIHTMKPTTSSSGVTARKPYYVVSFSPDCYIPCEIERKRAKAIVKQRALAIKSITKTEPVEGNCITVEGDGMYLAGKTMVPTHNTSLILFFTLWIILRDSERSNLYCSYTQSVVDVFYNGLLEVLRDPVTYAWQDVFPECRIASTNAKDLLLNINREKRYASFTGRSLYGTLNGACDCRGYEIADDLISGIEEAMNKDRLQSAWSKVENNYLPRGVGDKIKHLWIGTRWSLVDPQGMRMDLLLNEPKFANVRWKAINVPALNDDDESNFDYAFGVGFSTEQYQQRRASFERNNDMASWLAQYCGTPIERDGAVFSPDDLRFYNGVLPDATPDRVFMAIDPAWGGGDFCAGPVCYQFDNDLYVVDVVYSDKEKNVTQPLIVEKVIKHGVQAVSIEATKMTASYAEGVHEALNERGQRVNVQRSTSHFTGNGKEQRIFDKAPDIRTHMIFLEEGRRSKEYELFMQNVYSFSINGKNKHDDAPDSLAMAVEKAFFVVPVAEIVQRSRYGV